MARDKEKEKGKEKESQEKQPKSKNKIFLIGLPVLVVLIFAGAAGAYFLGVFGGSGGSAQQADAAQVETGKKKNLGPLLEMEDLVVNIMHKDNTRFLKVGITLETADEESKEAIERRMPQITDAVLLLVGNRTFVDIKDLQGKMQLKADLLARIQELSGRGKVEDIYFTDFVVQ
ncbi:MAG: flagellar basal body-associated protein FliL [Desulfosalsimonadaceae bacterium]